MYIILSTIILGVHYASSSILLFGPRCPNMLACTSDYYNIGTDPKVPADGLEKVKEYPQITIEPVIETAFYTGFTNQVSEFIMRLRKEYRVINENLIYPRVLFYLSQQMVKDYVRCHTVLVDLQTLKMLHYAQRMLLGYAHSNFTEKDSVDAKIKKEKYCIGMTYIDMAEKLSRYRKKRMALLEAEVKRLAWNVDNIPSVKATGRLYLLIDAFNVRPIFIMLLGSALLPTIRYLTR